jgi:hypothetical protein
MAPGFHSVEPDEYRPSKRPKTVETDSGAPETEAVVAVPTHPLGVKPAGNAYTSAVNSKANAGFFSRLPDELVAHLLESLDARELCVLGATCRALYAFSRSEELWKALFVE